MFSKLLGLSSDLRSTPGHIIILNITLTHDAFHSLYSKGRVLGHKRGKRNSRPNTSLVQIEGVGNKEDAQFYLGKVRVSCLVRVVHDF
jgi:hypothetical protein